MCQPVLTAAQPWWMNRLWGQNGTTNNSTTNNYNSTGEGETRSGSSTSNTA